MGAAEKGRESKEPPLTGYSRVKLGWFKAYPSRLDIIEHRWIQTRSSRFQVTKTPSMIYDQPNAPFSLNFIVVLYYTIARVP